MSAPVRTLALWCPDWPVVAHRVDPTAPAAVLVANRVLSANAAARAQGVRRGLRRREAQGRCPDLLVLERDEAAEARAFEPAVVAVEALTPRLELTRPGHLQVATRGPSRYWGGDESLAERTRHDVLGALGADLPAPATAAVGVADGPFAASLAARTARRLDGGTLVVPPGATPAFLAPHPLEVLEAPDLVGVLRRLGLRTLGDLAALPAADVLGRFGREGAEAHRLAAGLDERPPVLRRPPPDLEVVAELDPPALAVEPAAFVARGLAAELHDRLDGLGLACTRVRVELETEHAEQHVRLWRHDGALSASMVAERVRWQLEGWLAGDGAHRPTAGVTLLRLVPDEVLPADGRQLGLWGGTSRQGEQAARALARVQGLLGPEAVTVPEWRGARHPAAQVVLVPLAAVDLEHHRARGPAERAEAPWPGALPAPSPATVHPSPPLVEVRDGRGAVVRVDGRGALSATPHVLVDGARTRPITAWAGPWPLDERWWDAPRRRRLARLQVVLDDGTAHLVALEAGRWWLLASYD